MNYLKRSLLFLCLLNTSIFAEENSYITLSQNQIIHGDYYVAGRNVEISGRITGDLYVFGAQVNLDGRVDGDVIFAAGDLNISGAVGGSVRGTAAQFRSNGTIGENVSVLAANFDLGSGSKIAGRVLVLGASVDISGSIGESMKIYASSARISATTGGNLTAQVGSMRLTSSASVGGELDYSSSRKAYIDPDATIVGKVVFHPSLFSNVTSGSLLRHIKFGSKVATLLMNFFYTFVIGIIFMRYYREKMRRCATAMKDEPLKSVLTGLVVLVLLPIVALMMLMTIVGVPFALTLVAINVIGFYSAKVLFILWLSNSVVERWRQGRNRKLFYFFSLAIYFALTQIPYAGFILSTVATLLGVGAMVSTRSAKDIVETH